MRISGEWLICDDGLLRPVIPALVQIAGGDWAKVTFLLDAGADRTVFTAEFYGRLQSLQSLATASMRLAGVGGEASIITVETTIGFHTDEGRIITVRGPFGVFTQGESSDLCVLGRDEQF